MLTAVDAQRAESSRLIRLIAPFAAMTICAALILAAVPLTDVFRDTVPLGPDISAHAYPVWAAAQRLGSGGDLISWDAGWFDGWVAFRYYPPLPALLTALLSAFLPFAVAYKVVIASSVYLIPAAAAFVAWRVRRGWVNAAWAVVAATAYVLTPTCYLCGGSALSALTGEYANVLGMAFALWALGEFIGVLRGERPRALLALAVAATALTHPLPSVWLVVLFTAAFAVLTTIDPACADRRAAAQRLAAPLVIGAAASLWWWLPFVTSREWMTRPDFRSIDVLAVFQAIPGWQILLLLAIGGAAWAVSRRDALGIIFLVTGGAALVAALAIGADYLGNLEQIWNARLMPYALFGTYWLAVLAIRAGSDLVGFAGRRTVALAAACIAVVGYSAWVWGGLLPGISTTYTEQTVAVSANDEQVVRTYTSHFGPLAWSNPGIAESAGQRLRGQEESPRWPQMSALISTVDDLSRERGCSRVLVDQRDSIEVEGSLQQWPFPFTGALLPYWTRGCVKSLTGLQYDASFLTPAIVATDNLVSGSPEAFGVWSRRGDLDLVRGAIAMADMNVDYYITREEWSAAQARELGYSEVTARDGWVVFELPTTPPVEPLLNEPYVVTLQDGRELTDPHLWQEVSAQYLSTEFSTTDRLALGGPPGWQRISVGTVPDPKPLPQVEVSDIAIKGPDVSFRVSEPGVPVLIRRVPNSDWQVTGAEGPWPINPGFMVVVPTQNEISLQLVPPTSAAIGMWLSVIAVAAFMGLAIIDGWGLRPGTAVVRRLRPSRAGTPTTPDGDPR